MEYKQILLKAVDTFGKEKQMDMVLEECSELMTELIIYAKSVIKTQIHME